MLFLELITNYIGMIQENQEMDYRLRLSSKRLKSGNLQVRFDVSSLTGLSRYGYLLARPNTPLREVVEKIINELNEFEDPFLHQKHLFHVGRFDQQNELMVFP